MGRKYPDTDINTRSLAIYHHVKGKSLREIGKILNRTHTTIKYIIDRYNIEDRIENKPRNGCKKKLSYADERYIMRNIRADPCLSAPRISMMLEGYCGKNVCPETVRRIIRKNGYNGRKYLKKQVINEVNRVKRLEFASEYVKKPVTYWRDVLFTDESKFNIFGSDGNQSMWRKPNDPIPIIRTRPPTNQPGIAVMVWGCISYNGVGKLHFIEGNMNKLMYLDILRENLGASVESLGLSKQYKFYQDNDPKHKSYLAREWLLYNTPKTLDTPPQSPDLNPIENVWKYLKQRMQQKHIYTKEALVSLLQTEWDSIDQEYIRNLIDSVPDRLRNVIEQNGYMA